jgi:hypothetical protein
MSRYTEQSEAEREYNRRLVADAPPLTEHQKAIIRAAFTGTDLTQRSTG